jgi:hypothetical protein
MPCAYKSLRNAADRVWTIGDLLDAAMAVQSIAPTKLPRIGASGSQQLTAAKSIRMDSKLFLRQ